MNLQNRIAMAPMTRGFAMNGEVDQSHVDYYRRRAEGGTGLVLTEGVVVDRPASRNEPNVPKFYGPSLEGWKPVVEAVHGAGGAIAPQIWHTGAVRSSTQDWEPEGPVERGFLPVHRHERATDERIARGREPAVCSYSSAPAPQRRDEERF